MDRVDARYKTFKEKLKKLGYIKDSAKQTNKIVEKIGDFGMMSDTGNKKIARATRCRGYRSVQQRTNRSPTRNLTACISPRN